MKYNSDPIEGADIRTMAANLREYFISLYEDMVRYLLHKFSLRSDVHFVIGENTGNWLFITSHQDSPTSSTK